MDRTEIARELILTARTLVGINVGETIETAVLRIHRYRGSIRVTDLENAGKRGKKVDEFIVDGLDRSTGVDDSSVYELLDTIEASRNYADALRNAEKFVSEYKNSGIYESSLRGVDVTPAGFKKIKIRNDNVLIESDFDSFAVRDLVDRHNEPTCIPSASGGKKDVKLFYRWVSDNQSELRNMTFQQVISAMRANGIKYHHYCAMD